MRTIRLFKVLSYTLTNINTDNHLLLKPALQSDGSGLCTLPNGPWELPAFSPADWAHKREKDKEYKRYLTVTIRKLKMRQTRQEDICLVKCNKRKTTDLLWRGSISLDASSGYSEAWFISIQIGSCSHHTHVKQILWLKDKAFCTMTLFTGAQNSNLLFVRAHLVLLCKNVCWKSETHYLLHKSLSEDTQYYIAKQMD